MPHAKLQKPKTTPLVEKTERRENERRIKTASIVATMICLRGQNLLQRVKIPTVNLLLENTYILNIGL